jgi:hypothetical protein
LSSTSSRSSDKPPPALPNADRMSVAAGLSGVKRV